MVQACVMKILVACEYSGKVRDAFIKRGHSAVSCDLLDTDAPGPHYKGNVMDIINNGWDMLIGFPPCTYVCSSGLHHNKNNPERQQKTKSAVEFFKSLLSSNIAYIALENPIGCLSTMVRKPNQIIQPYQFGHDASKSTCLWLKNLPALKPTKYIPPRYIGGLPRWGNQTDSGQNKLSPTKDRWKIRSETYTGIAEAMAEQWGKKHPIQMELKLHRPGDSIKGA